MKDFKKLLIWQKGMVLASEIYKASKFFPKEELFGLRSQTTRAAVSIPANIAKGSAKKSPKEYKYFLEVSLGPAFELETHLLIAKGQNWFPEEIIDELLSKVTEEQRMLSSFMTKLET
ncbi:MAG TPA: four helix bundle protein [Chryseolinea sp.]|nr:four helix bundle protein [Chryseolinea sp.]